MPKRATPSLTDRVSALVFKAGMGLLQRLPYERRIPLAGRLLSGVAPLLGFRRRIRANLALTCPDLPPAEVARLCKAVPDNIGRTLAEMFSGTEFITRMRDIPLEGPGAARLTELKETGKACVLVSGHFGNYDAARGVLIARGFPIAGLYRPMNNALFNRDYLAAIETVGTPLYPRDRRGMTNMLRHLKNGGMIALATDQYFRTGAVLQFFGKPAPSPLSAAEMALRLDIDLIPIYAIRQPDGLSFRFYVGEPVPHTTPEEMTQVTLDSLEGQVRAHMEQWLWIHRRWNKT
ncbi:lysophospholipid acyltransferase family protein [Thioclava litoralis]|uniref:Lysophospholipid acyltransferase family protein n=1 Tax=Thioclava litoralis TaxID=3076557 RepID=A0ABZ1E007_9RHOB|nr:lysophospholipid acyltransferase family protein [Thioclava sp. FTW29]